MHSHLPLKELAEKIGKPYPTLLRELNPYDKGAKLGVETLLEIMKVTGNIAPLVYMAEEMGYELAPAAAKVDTGKGNGCCGTRFEKVSASGSHSHADTAPCLEQQLVEPVVPGTGRPCST